MSGVTTEMIRIEFASNEDLVDINQIRNEFSIDESNNYKIGNWNENNIVPLNNQVTLVAKNPMQIIGVIRCHRDGDWVAEIFIASNYRRGGIGTLLFTKMMIELENNHQAERIIAGVLPNNSNALKLLKKLGFSILRKNIKRDGELDGEFWALDLKKKVPAEVQAGPCF